MKLLLDIWRPYLIGFAVITCVGLMINVGATPVYDLTTGAGVYKTYCRNCHGDDGRGKGYAADFVGDKERMAKTDEELLKSIRNGMNGKLGYMPGWNNLLTEEQMKMVLRYIRDTFGESSK